jgi:hypothetical protein
MFGSTITEVAIGIIFVYLLLSLICSAVNEIIESLLKNRATDLERGISVLFNQENGGKMIEAFYKHPLISGLFRGAYKPKKENTIRFWHFLLPTNLPSYIPARNFSSAVIDLILHPTAFESNVQGASTGTQAAVEIPVNPSIPPATMANLRPNISEFGGNQFAQALRALAEQSGNDINKMRENLEAWFNGSMDRVSGTYKRRTQWVLFIMGLIITILLNVNTITIVKRLTTDTTLRQLVVAQAEIFAKRPDALTPNLEENRKQLEALNLPIGWENGIHFSSPFSEDFHFLDYLIRHLLGWLLTAGAISLGAPFWFDLLNKFMVIRSTVKPHEKSLEEGSEDRQSSALTPPASPANAPVNMTTPVNNLPAGTTGTPVVSEPPPTNSESTAVGETVFTGAEAPGDIESDLDGCDAPLGNITLDEELPSSEGGVE